MKTKAVSWILATAFAAAACSVALAAAPYEGVITGNDVYVRSGPGTGAYACAKLSAPARVTVVGQLDSWLKVLPPKGCYSVVSKDYVKPDATGKTGTISGDNVWVRAAGVLRDADFFTLQSRLNTNDTVEIIGRSGDYYQIKPPKDAHFWIAAQFVKRADAAAGTAEAPTGSVPATGGTVSVGVVPRNESTDGETTLPTTAPVIRPAATGGEVQIPVGMEQFAAAEKLLLAEYKKPVSDRNYDSLLAAYNAVNVTGDNENLKKYVDFRVSLIAADIQRRKDLGEVTKLVGDVRQREQELRLAQAKLQAEAPTTRPITSYAAQGILLVSDLFPGTAAATQRYIIRDRVTYFINAYVQCMTGAVNLDNCVGKYVGIIGSTKFDKNLGLDVVEARDVRVLGESAELPMPPKPVIKPMPTPAPTPPAPIRPMKPEIPAGTAAQKPATTTPAAPTPLVAPEPKTTVTPLVPTTAPVAPTPLVAPEPKTTVTPLVPTPAPAPTPKIEVKPEPLVAPVPKIEVKPEPLVAPVPKIDVKPEPLVAPVPKIEVKPEPLVAPAPKIEPKPAPVVVPTPKIEVKPEPLVAPAPKIEPKPAPVVVPTPKIEVKPAPVVVPTPKIEVKPTPVVVPAPKIEPKPAPVVVPAPKIEPKTAPVVVPTPKVEPKPEPLVAPVPKIEPKPAPVVVPAPKIEPKPAPVVVPAPKIEPKPAPVVVPAPKIEPKPAPVVVPAPKIEPKPAPVVVPAPKIEPKPAPVVVPAPKIEVKPVVPVVRFGPATTQPATTQPAATPTTMSTTQPAGKEASPSAAKPLLRKVETGAEEEYD